jgi:hypothetical protein
VRYTSIAPPLSAQRLGSSRPRYSVSTREKMEMVTIKAVAFANGEPCPIAGQYLQSFNCEAYNGRGYAVWTDDLKKALKFDNATEAMLFWRQQSRRKPKRPDGKPNRPLTSTTIVIE